MKTRITTYTYSTHFNPKTPNAMPAPVFRFAPSPNGALHLGHAFSALINHQMARAANGRFLLRIEDIDLARCRPEQRDAIFDDLKWLGLDWEAPVRLQSQHFADYNEALERLIDEELVYRAFMTRGDVRAFISGRQHWPRDPDGAPLYPGLDKHLPAAERQSKLSSAAPFAWRLDMAAALQHVQNPITWLETGSGPDGETGTIKADPAAWGDVVIARSDVPTSYHLAVIVDDAVQGISDVVRGLDLFHATAVQRLLQDILGLPIPDYHHHRLILDDDGRKLSKSRGDTSLAALRKAGATPADIRRRIGFQ